MASAKAKYGKYCPIQVFAFPLLKIRVLSFNPEFRTDLMEQTQVSLTI